MSQTDIQDFLQIDPQGQAMFESFKEPEVLDCIFSSILRKSMD